MRRFKRRPATVEAIRYTGKNREAVEAFAGDGSKGVAGEGNHPLVETPVRTVAMAPNDWLVRGVAGELNVLKPDAFAARYKEEEAPDDGGA